MKINKYLWILTGLLLFINAHSQAHELQIQIEFLNKDKPIEKGGFFSDDQLEIRIIISNTSKEVFIIPKPEISAHSGNPYPIFTKMNGDSLNCKLDLSDIRTIPDGHLRNDYSFELLESGDVIRLIVDTLDGCELSFEKGSKYKIQIIFNSIFRGNIIIDEKDYRIWNGLVRSNTLVFEY